MIAIVSSVARERLALVALCDEQWPVTECDSVRTFNRLLGRTQPKVVLTRHKLADGYSDEILALLGRAGFSPGAKVIVLCAAGAPPSLEARQITLGADTVMRDPVRMEVLLAYLKKYYQSASAPPPADRSASARTIAFAGALLKPRERLFVRAGKSVVLTPRENALVEALAGSAGEAVSYDTLYSEVLGRRFNGDTSNMRVLLGKLTASAATIGIRMRDWIEVIPKAGYCYREDHKPPPDSTHGAKAATE